MAEWCARCSGHSSGGWSSLWLQIEHPEVFGGVWSLAPDPVDFRDFVKEHQLAFKALDKFGPDELEERQRLLFELSALIWSAPTVSAS